MLDTWTGEVVGTAHIHQVALNEIAAEAGMSRQMLSRYLNGKASSPSAEFRIRKALLALVEKRSSQDAESYAQICLQALRMRSASQVVSRVMRKFVCRL